MRPRALLERCAEELGAEPSPDVHAALRTWSRTLDEPGILGLAEALVERPEEAWEELVRAHRAHRHPWYDVLADRLDAQCWAEFLWENTAFPGFIPLLERLRETQLLERGRAAIERNLADEHVPAPHRELMRRLMLAVRERAPRRLGVRSLPSNARRTLVFYYGYACDPWHLVGSLFATETMAWHRITSMGRGLRRLGLDEHELEFIAIHSECDEQHAREWMDEVIQPSISARPALRSSVAHGIAACLATSASYLDDLCRRFARQG